VPSPPSTSRSSGQAWLPFAGIVLAYMLATVTRADADLWGHLRFGLDLLRDRRLTSVDPYSFTQDKPWVNHEWLSELLMGVSWTLGGSAGLITLKALMLTGVIVIVWTGLGGASYVARLSVIVGLVVGTIHVTSSIRPQVWTILAVAVLCRTLVRDQSRERRWLPILFAVWVNCHGGWIVGIGTLGVWAAVDALGRRARVKEWSVVVAACIAATLVNPYGWGLWLFLAETVRLGRSDITEWGPLWGTPWLNWIPWVAATIGIGWVARQRSEVRWPTLAVLVMLSCASLRVMRIESLYVTAAAILLAPAICARWPAKATPLVSLIARHERWAALVILAVIGAVALRFDVRSTRCIGVWSATRPDQRALPSLVSARPGRLVTFFDWGQYALWHLGPRLKVSMDGRRETVYTDRRLEEHAAIISGSEAGVARLAEWRAEYVWLPASSTATKSWLAANGYRLDVETDRSFIAVRSDLPQLRAPLPNSAAEPACFPG
jgi:hypothetical protein